MDTIGQIFTLTCAGESHGEALVGIVGGMPPGITVDYELLEAMMERRRPRANVPGGTQRREADKVEIVAGTFNGHTTGAPIALVIHNNDARPSDYKALQHVLRPSHADATYHAKYGQWRDYRGGGASSARITSLWTAAGALAMMVLRTQGISVEAGIRSIGPITADRALAWPDEAMTAALDEARHNGDSLGAVVTGCIKGMPAGVGEPPFGKFHSRLAQAMMSINAAKGFEIGMGYDGAQSSGNATIDQYDATGQLQSNNSGGVLGGITTGQPITFTVAFKPIATIGQAVSAIDTDGRPVMLRAGGRHDVCVVPRVLPVVEAMAAITALDALLLSLATFRQ